MKSPQRVLHAAAWLAVILLPTAARSADPLPYDVELQVVRQELSPDFCWFHPRAAAIPGLGRDGGPAVVLTLQKHLRASDHYSGLYFLRSDDLGRTWTDPVLPPELDWQPESEMVDVAVCDVTPGWHPQSRRLIAIGTKLRYSKSGEQWLDRPGSHQCAYAVYDPQTGAWQTWKMLDLPDVQGRFHLVAPGCVQWLVRPDGTLLVPCYFKGAAGTDYAVTVLHCRFDGQTLTLIEHGDELTMTGGRGLAEPSLAFFGGTYVLTIRNDAGAFVTTSEDGLHFAPLSPWRFDDGSDLGSYNTQQHWLVHSEGLFLAYTRRGADNDHIFRHRAPLFLAQVNPKTLTVLRRTEQVLIPERGVPLGNFGACPISPEESWVTDAEYILSAEPHPRGGDGSVFVARVRWAAPNRLARSDHAQRIITLGDSITKGVRTGVDQSETFASLLEAELRQAGHDVEVLNLGIGGERTDQALERLARDVLSHEPAIVTIMYGTNDSYVDRGQTTPRLSRAQFRENLSRLVARLRNAGITPVLMTEPRWADNAGPNGIGQHPNELLETYMQECREVAEETGAALVDHYAYWSEARRAGVDLSTWTTDACHPNPTGHRVLAETLRPVVAAVMESLAPRVP